MNPVWQFILGYLMLSATITYAWWTHIRVFLLQMDLDAIGDEFAAIAVDRGRGNDTDIRSFLDALDDLIEAAPTLSPAIIGPMSRLPGVGLAGCLGTGPEPFLELFLDPEPKPPELTVALWKVSVRLGRYLALETFSGWVSIARAMLFGIDGPEPISMTAAPATLNLLEFIAFANLLSRGKHRQAA